MAATGPGLNFPLRTVGQIIRADIVCYVTTRQQVGMFSSYYRVDSVGGAGSTLGAVASAVDTLFRVFTKQALSVNAAYRGVIARMIAPIPPSPPAYDNTNAAVGSVAGDLLPTQTCGVISLYTQFGGRAYRGRRYIPFPSEGDNGADSTPSAGYLANLDSIKQQLLTPLAVGAADNIHATPILFHRETNTYTDLVGGVSRSGWGTQRRRSYFGRTNPLPL